MCTVKFFMASYVIRRLWGIPTSRYQHCDFQWQRFAVLPPYLQHFSKQTCNSFLFLHQSHYKCAFASTFLPAVIKAVLEGAASLLIPVGRNFIYLYIFSATAPFCNSRRMILELCVSVRGASPLLLVQFGSQWPSIRRYFTMCFLLYLQWTMNNNMNK